MILRRDVVQERLDYLRGVVGRLSKLRMLDRERLLSDEELLWSAERGLQLGAQKVLDVGAHLLVTAFNTRAAAYEDVIRLLGERSVISKDLQRRLKGLGGFRNVLVHGYLEIDDERTYKFLQHDSLTFGEFADSIELWLADHP